VGKTSIFFSKHHAHLDVMFLNRCLMLGGYLCCLSLVETWGFEWYIPILLRECLMCFRLCFGVWGCFDLLLLLVVAFISIMRHPLSIFAFLGLIVRGGCCFVYAFLNLRESSKVIRIIAKHSTSQHREPTGYNTPKSSLSLKSCA
jgi:hypothetical protein